VTIPESQGLEPQPHDTGEASAPSKNLGLLSKKQEEASGEGTAGDHYHQPRITWGSLYPQQGMNPPHHQKITGTLKLANWRVFIKGIFF
jgi:hypothetical protein